MVVNEVREMNMPALLTRVYKGGNLGCTSETVAVFKGKVFASSEEHDANQHLQSPCRVPFHTQLSTPKPTARKAMTIEMVVQGRVHHKLRPKPKPRAIRTLPRAAMASDREEKHRKHTGPDGCGNVVLIEGEDEEDEDEEKTYA